MSPLQIVDFQNTEIAFKDRSDSELRKMLSLFSLINNSALASICPKIIRTLLFIKFPINGLLKKSFFSHFCGGESIPECEKLVAKLAQRNIGSILNYSVEGEYCNKNFDLATQEIIRTIHQAKLNQNIPFAVFKPTGLISYKILTKIQKNEKLNSDENVDYDLAVKRVEKLCSTANSHQIPIFIDAEKTWFQDPIDQLCYQMMEKFNKTFPIVFTTIQTYRKDSLSMLEQAITSARQKKYFFGIKLVRGAYLEEERKRAIEMNYPSPVFNLKNETDTSFNNCLRLLMENIDICSVCVATHNEESSALMTELLDKKGIPTSDKRICFSQLLGMSDHITYNLADKGYRSSKYVPYGPVESVLPYLFRRAEENTSIAGQSGREYNLILKEAKRRGWRK